MKQGGKERFKAFHSETDFNIFGKHKVAALTIRLRTVRGTAVHGADAPWCWANPALSAIDSR